MCHQKIYYKCVIMLDYSLLKFSIAASELIDSPGYEISMSGIRDEAVRYVFKR